MPERRFPPPLARRAAAEPLRRAQRQQTTTRLRLLRERTGATVGSEIAHAGLGAKDRQQYRQAAGVAEEGVNFRRA